MCSGQFGPQLTALIAYLTVVCRITRRLVQVLLEDWLHTLQPRFIATLGLSQRGEQLLHHGRN